MNGAVFGLVLFTFAGGLAGLAVLVVAIVRGRIDWSGEGGRVIFDPGEEGQVEEPAAESAHATSALARLVSRDAERGGAAPTRPIDRRSQEDMESRRVADVS